LPSVAGAATAVATGVRVELSSRFRLVIGKPNVMVRRFARKLQTLLGTHPENYSFDKQLLIERAR